MGPLVISGPYDRWLAPLQPIGVALGLAALVLWWRQRRERQRAHRAPLPMQPMPVLPPRPPGTRRLGRMAVTPPRPAGDEEATTIPAVLQVPGPLAARAAAGPTPATEAPRPRATDWSAAVFEQIEWRRFEAVVEALFAQAGFRTESQSHGADEGVDIWLHSAHHDGGPVSLVQCKHWRGKRVGVDKVRELKGVMAARGVRRGQFATTSTFTPEAEAFAAQAGIHLLDQSRLLALIATRSAPQQAALLEVAQEGDYWRPTCVNCGVKMAARRPRAGGPGFWGCVNFPRCRTTMPMRA